MLQAVVGGKSGGKTEAVTVVCYKCYNNFNLDVVVPEIGWFICMQCVEIGASLIRKSSYLHPVELGSR